MTLDEFQNEVGAWGDATFPKSNAGTVVSHLYEEFGEFFDAYNDGDKSIQEEAADMFLLIMQFAHKSGFSLFEAAEAKMVKNRVRTWDNANPTPGGHVKHVEAATE